METNRLAFPDLFLEDMLPELTDIIVERYQAKPDKVPMVFNVSTMDKSIEYSDTISTFPAAVQVNEGSSINYYAPKQGYDKAYIPNKYGLGFKVTEEMIEDEKWGLIAKLAAALGKSVFETKQIVAFNVFNNGFTDTGPDGVSLFNASHPLNGGGTWSNTAAADLTVTSLENACIAFSDLRDDENKHISVAPKYLLIPTALKFTAREILESQLKSGTGNNNVNSLMDENIEIITCDFLTDTGQWVLLADKGEHDIQYKERRAPKVEGGYEFDSGSGKTKMTTRFVVGYNDPRGAYSAT